MIRSIADDVGFNIVNVECYDIIGDTAALTEGTITAQLGKAKSCAPSILLLCHVEALSRKSESSATGRSPPIVKVLEDALGFLKTASSETGWPCVLIGTTADEDAVPPEVLGCFKQDISLSVGSLLSRVMRGLRLLTGTKWSRAIAYRSRSIQSRAPCVRCFLTIHRHSDSCTSSRRYPLPLLSRSRPCSFSRYHFDLSIHYGYPASWA